MQNQLVQILNANHEELCTQYQRVLRDSLFLNRALVRPNMVKDIAVKEVEAILTFLQQSGFSGAEHGVKLHQMGLGERVILRLGQITRQFFLAHLENIQIGPMLEMVDTYQEAVFQGFIQSLEKTIVTEQERTRNAFYVPKIRDEVGSSDGK